LQYIPLAFVISIQELGSQTMQNINGPLLLDRELADPQGMAGQLY
jgi:hypothetical protein